MTLRGPSPALGLWSSLADALTPRLLAAAGPDWVVLDAQHGTWTDTRLSEVLPVLAVGPPVWVRVPDDRAAGIGRALDAGAAGVVVPLVESAEQAADAAAACRYPPTGRRSFGPMLPLAGRAAPGSTAEADAAAGCAVMVETARALDAVTAIAAAPGVDLVFVGPFDLALALGRTVDDLLADTAPDAPLAVVVAACRAAGVRAGAFAGDPRRAARLLELGFTDVVVATDAGLLAAGAAAALDGVRRVAGVTTGATTAPADGPAAGSAAGSAPAGGGYGTA